MLLPFVISHELPLTDPVLKFLLILVISSKNFAFVSMNRFAPVSGYFFFELFSPFFFLSCCAAIYLDLFSFLLNS